MTYVDIPEAVGGGYRDFWYSRCRYRVIKGGKGSKKSSTTALWYILHLMRHPQANLLVVRRYYRTHADSTYAQLLWAIHRLRVEHLWKATKEPLELCYTPTGQRILFRGFDNPDKLASTTVPVGRLCWVWVEEAFEISDEADFDKLDLSVPRGFVGEHLFKQTTVTFNPWSADHWLKRRFFDRKSADVFTMTTNYLCNEFLDAADVARFEEMRVRRPRQYAVAGLGEWGIAEGCVFDDWEIADFDEQTLDGEFSRLFGLDYGYTNDPTAFIAAAADEKGQRLYIFDEFYRRRLLNPDIAAILKERGYAKERIRADSAEPKSNEELRRLGIRRLVAADKGPDSVRSGIARLQEYHFVVHPRCVHTAAELRAYVWERAPDGHGYVNRPVDRDNHLMDALRYAAEDIRRDRTGSVVGRYG